MITRRGLRWAGAAILGAALAVGPLGGGAASTRNISLNARALSLPQSLLRDDVRYLGGFSLTSDDPAFGGLSGLEMIGGRLLAITDRGAFLDVAVARARAGAITSFGAAAMGPLLDQRGRPLRGRGADAEALALAPSGKLWIGLEQRHRVIRVDRLGGPRTAFAGAIPSGDFGRNTGVEGLAATADGVLWAVIEEPPKGWPEDELIGFRLAGGQAERFVIERQEGYAATGLSIGPDGAAYLLERRYDFWRGVRMRLRRFTPRDMSSAAWGAGETLIQLSQRAPIDNMEALSVDRSADGGLVATMISDDNFRSLQRTVLLQFALPEASLGD